MPIAPLNNQVVFKKLLSDEEILKAFIKDFLDIDLTPQTIEVEKKFIPPVGGVDIEIDIFVDDPTNRIVIEIQRERYDYDFDRFWHYHIASQLELVKSHKKYKLERTVYTIVWFTRKVREKQYQRSLMTTNQITTTELSESMILYPHQMFFLNPFYLSDKTPQGLKDWMTLVVESVNNPTHPKINLNRPIMQKAAKLIDDDGLTPQERMAIIDERDYNNMRRKEWEEGRIAEKQNIARNLLIEGVELTLIAKTTGLSIAEIEALT
jgi:predicted transposase/invertase (TIGR01784 family)